LALGAASNFWGTAYVTAVSATGNITGSYILGNGSQLTGITTGYGYANVAANLAAFGSNPVSTTGNITGNYILGNGSQLTGIAGAYGNANVVANLAALGSNPVSTTGNITGGNLIQGTTRVYKWTTATSAPASARACAKARPIPWPPPVTSTTFPLSEKRSRMFFEDRMGS
jgi:hypothetical protein